MTLAWPPFGTSSGAAPPEPPGGAITIAASVWRFDGNSGSVRVSSGAPLQPGQVTAATLSEVRVYVGAPLVEQAVALHPLDGTHPDGSYRSIGIQFLYTLTHAVPVAAEIRVHTGTARGTTDIAWVEPTHLTVRNRAVIAPTDPVHLCGTFVTLGPLTPAVNDAGNATGAAWAAYAAARWSDPNVPTGLYTGGATYDHCNGLLMLYCRTGVRSWYEAWYNWAMSIPGDPVSGFASGNADGVFTLVPYGLASFATEIASSCSVGEKTVINLERIDGTNTSCGGPAEWYSLRLISYASAYWMGAWRQHKRNLVRMVNSSTGLVETGYTNQRDFWVTGFGHRFNFGAAALHAVLLGYLTGCTTKVPLGNGFEGPDTWDYATFLPWTITALVDKIYTQYGYDIVGQNYSGYSVPVPGDQDTGISTFMISLIPAEYLMMYYDLVYPDARIPGLMQKLADYSISQYRQSLFGDTEYPNSWVSSYTQTRPAVMADPYFTATISTSTNRMTYVSGTLTPDDWRAPGNWVQWLSGTGSWSTTRPYTNNQSGPAGLDPSSSTYWVMSEPAAVSGTVTCMMPTAGWFLAMATTMFAWVYASTGNTLYRDWRDRVAKTANMRSDQDGGGLNYQTKTWGEFFGGLRQSYLYYAHGGTIRGTPGVHPTVITNPPIQPTLG